MESRKKNRKIGNISKTLLILNLRNDVSKTDLLKYFIGCKKITMKQSQLPPYHKYNNNYSIFYSHQYLFYSYAFLLHNTAIEAENNRKRPINHGLFGPDCYIEYAKNNFDNSTKHQDSDKWNVLVRQIPENVTEERLRKLFTGCHSIFYIPARNVSKKTNDTSTTKNKVLLG